MKKEWRLILGFSVLLLLILLIGIIGIYQIQFLSKKVEILGKRYFPIQRAILGMKVSNNLYAMHIRNYVFWKFSRYLEAARFSVTPELIKETQMSFEKNLDIYSKLIKTQKEKKWSKRVFALHRELIKVGGKIVTTVDKINQVTSNKRKSLEQAIKKMLMDFENKLYRIDNFLDTNLQNFNLEMIKRQLQQTETAKKSALFFLNGFLIFVLFLGTSIAILVYQDRKKERAKKAQLIQRMINFEEKERQNLSFQIHNQMSQDLSALKIYLGIIEKKFDKSKELEESKKILLGLIEKAHNISELLRPPGLDEVGLLEMIETLIVHYRHLTGANFIYKKPEKEPKLSEEYSLTLYRVVQEALTNVAKHSKAKNVEMKLEVRDKFLELSIFDDGVGFDYEEFLKKSRRQKEDRLKLGLLGLRERVELLEGTMQIETAPSKGTKIKVKLNLV